MWTRKVDSRGRVVLPSEFTGKTVIVEWTNDELRIRIAKPRRPRVTLNELLAQVTPENQHDLVDFGPPVGSEVI